MIVTKNSATQLAALLQLQSSESEIESSSEDLKTILSMYVESSSFIHSDVLWKCLLDLGHDNLITGFVKSKLEDSAISGLADENDIHFIVNLKQNILDHLTSLLQSYSIIDSKLQSYSMVDSKEDSLLPSQSRAKVSRLYLLHCLRMGAYLSLNIPIMKKTGLEKGNIGVSLSFHYLLSLVPSLVLTLLLHQAMCSPIRTKLSNLSAAYFHLIFATLV